MNTHVKITQGEVADLSRRSFLVGTAAAGLTLGYAAVPGLDSALAATAPTNFDPSVWYSISPDGTHPLQKAWIAEQVPQCGYCQSGQIMQAAELLASNKNPTRAQIVEHMDGNVCRCGTYLRIISAVQRAAREG